MIFLDANAFYSYYGRSKLGMTSEPVDEERLKKYLEQQREKSLPTSVYIEIMTHFRNNPKVLQNLLEFRYAKGLPLFNNIPDYVVSEDEITSVAYMDQAALKNYADRLLKSKIQIESKFTLLFFEITKDLYTHYKLEMTDGLSQKNKDAILGYIGRVAYKEYQNLLEERIKVELQSGYDENKEKKVLKDFYIQELNEACVLTNIIIQGCVACKQDKDDIITAKYFYHACIQRNAPLYQTEQAVCHTIGNESGYGKSIGIICSDGRCSRSAETNRKINGRDSKEH